MREREMKRGDLLSYVYMKYRKNLIDDLTIYKKEELARVKLSRSNPLLMSIPFATLRTLLKFKIDNQ